MPKNGYATLMWQRREEVVQEMRSILDDAVATNRDLRPEEVKRIDVLEAAAADYTKQANQAEAADKYALEATGFRGKPAGDVSASKPDSIRDLIVTAQERGYAVADFPVNVGVRALATSAQTVPTEFVDRLTAYERDAAPMLDPNIVTINTFNDGRSRIFPLLSADPAVGGTVTAEAGGITDADATLGAGTVTPYKFAVMQTWSNELQYDAFTNLEDALARSAGRELGVDINTLLTTGDGSSKPEGWVTGATNGGTANRTAGWQSTDTLFSAMAIWASCSIASRRPCVSGPASWSPARPCRRSCRCETPTACPTWTRTPRPARRGRSSGDRSSRTRP